MFYLLIINTSFKDKTFLALYKNDKLVSKSILKTKYKQAEKLLPGIERLLQKARVCLKNLKGIIVVKGPGPFTALRIGVVTANTLAFALGIPVIGIKATEFNKLSESIEKTIKKLKRTKKIKKEKIVIPFYGREAVYCTRSVLCV